jgi:hypothetical protein
MNSEGSMTPEEIAEGRSLYQSVYKGHATGTLSLDYEVYSMWLTINADALLNAAEENAALRAEVERLRDELARESWQRR